MSAQTLNRLCARAKWYIVKPPTLSSPFSPFYQVATHKFRL